jgi:putative SOS response-associated peptidase YedK
MCGKFTAMMSWGEYCALAGTPMSGGGDGPDAMPADKPLGTFTPMSSLPVLHLNSVRQRRITPMRWGWYDHRNADPRGKPRHLHARSEEIDSKPTWIEPFHDGHGVVFTKSFNIGEEIAPGKTKQWVCSRADGEPVAIAVIYQAFETVSGPMLTCVMVTTESCAPLNARDNRMPALLHPNEIAMWLGETAAKPAEIKALLRPYEGSLVIHEQEPTKSRASAKPRPASKTKPSGQSSLF